jgi:hypothetical protein
MRLFSPTTPAVAIVLMLAATAQGAAFETAKNTTAAQILGPAVHGPGYSVEPMVRSDGFTRTFIIDVTGGKVQVNGVALIKQRVHEFATLNRLERMTQSDAFTKALGSAALAPVRFGADLITKPGETINNTFSGIGNMFDRIGAGVSERKAARDSAPDSLFGVSQKRREFAVELGVDPYTDFVPLAQKLERISRAAAMGGLSVQAALAFVPGVGGLAVSSTATAGNIKATLRDKTSAQIVQEVKASLARLGVSPDTAEQFVNNRSYSPADLLVISDALTRLNASNSEAFVANVAKAEGRDLAVFQRSRAAFLADRSAELGTLTEFVLLGDVPLNRAADGTIVAAFPFDDLTWTEPASRQFAAMTSAVRAVGSPRKPVLASSATITPMARSELTKLGWTVVALKPQT